MTREEFRNVLMELSDRAMESLSMDDIYVEMMLACKRVQCSYEIAFVEEIRRRREARKGEEA